MKHLKPAYHHQGQPQAPRLAGPLFFLLAKKKIEFPSANIYKHTEHQGSSLKSIQDYFFTLPRVNRGKIAFSGHLIFRLFLVYMSKYRVK